MAGINLESEPGKMSRVSPPRLKNDLLGGGGRFNMDLWGTALCDHGRGELPATGCAEVDACVDT